MSKLTQKQEKFVQALISGKSQREAYKEAYNAANMKDATVDKRACELLKNGKVAGRYEALKAEEEARQREKYSLDRDKALESYLWLVNEAKETIRQICRLHTLRTQKRNHKEVRNAPLPPVLQRHGPGAGLQEILLR